MQPNGSNRGLPAMHPGELLREDVLPAIGKSNDAIADLLGVPRQVFADILAERTPVTPEMALRIGKLCGNGPAFWLNLQRTFDLRKAEAEIGDALLAIPNLNAAA